MVSLKPAFPRLSIAVLGVVAIFATRSEATTFIVMSDDDLVQSSDVITLGTVQAISTTPEPGAPLETRVIVSVEEQVKGMSSATVTMAVPGGAVNGTRRVVFGAPQFFVGERVLVFLRHRPDGQLIANGLAMGKYTVVHGTRGDVARRQLGGSGAVVLGYDKRNRKLTQAPASDERPLPAFLDTLRQLVEDSPQIDGLGAAVVEAPPSTIPQGEAFTFLGSPAARWIEPDQGKVVSYLVVPAGDAVLGAAQSMTAVHDAMAAWSNAGSSLRLVDGGAGTPAPFQRCDGVSTIQFNDPFGEIGAPVNCSGVLAIGGFCTSDSATSTVDDTTFLRIGEGDLTINDGFGGCRYWTAANLSEVITHELGHTVGLGHSSENPTEPSALLRDATMFYLAHFDGRGAALRADDVAAIRTLYPDNQPDQDGDGVPDGVDNCPTLANADQADGDQDGVGDVCDLVMLRTLKVDGVSGALTFSAVVRFPADVAFVPSRDMVRVELQDDTGALYAGTIPSRGMRRNSRTRQRYTGLVSGSDGKGVASFTWVRGSAATFTVHTSTVSVAMSDGSGAMLRLTFGQQTFAKHFTIQRDATGSWVCP